MLACLVDLDVGKDGGLTPLGGLVYFKNVGAYFTDGGLISQLSSTLPDTSFYLVTSNPLLNYVETDLFLSITLVLA